MLHINRTVLALLVGTSVFAFGSTGRAALVLQLKASNYDPATGVWTDSATGNNATQATAGNRPTLVAGQTPNGSSVVRFDGANDSTSDFLSLTNSIPTLTAADGYTAFAVVKTGAGHTSTIFSGTQGSFQYRVDGDGKQQDVRTYEAGIGKGNTVLLASAFSSINTTVNSAGSTYRFDGSADGTAGGSSFTQPITLIGRNAQGGGGAPESFLGDIAEIRIYNTQLDAGQIAAVETELNNTYVVPEPSSLAVFSLAGLALASRRRKV